MLALKEFSPLRAAGDLDPHRCPARTTRDSPGWADLTVNEEAKVASWIGIAFGPPGWWLFEGSRGVRLRT
jgi:hypothetical protein